MKKLFSYTVFVLLLLLILCYFAVAPLAKYFIETSGSDALGVPVTVKHIDLSPTDASITLQNLVIHNPKGFESEHAIQFGQVDIKLNTDSLNTNTIELTHINFADPDMIYELGLGSSNINRILQITKENKGTDSDTDNTAASSNTDSKPSLAFVIKQLVVERARVRVAFAGTEESFLLDKIELNDLGTKQDGMALNRVMVTLMSAIISELAEHDFKAFVNNLKNKLDDFKEDPESHLNAIGESIKQGAQETSDSIKKWLE